MWTNLNIKTEMLGVPEVGGTKIDEFNILHGRIY